MMMRAERVRELIKKEVSEILSRELKDPRVGFVTITDVQVSADLRRARILYTVYGDDAQRRQTQEGLERATGFVRGRLGHRVQLRYVPEIAFMLDTSMEKAMHVHDLLAQIENEEQRKEERDLSE